jgi:DNA transposition AAA+ family ATPase
VRIIGALSYAQAAADVAVIYGGAGLGKTSAIEHYRATSLNVWVATMSPATSSPVTAMEEVCSALGMTEQGGAAKLFRAIVRKVKGTRGLLIIDEAQALSTSALDQIRAIHDRAGVGLALVGNQEVYARLTGGNRAAHLDRLYSRVGKRLALKASTDDDIDSLIAAWDIGDTKCRGLLFDIARKPGALRSLTKVLRLAAMHAYAQKQRVCCEHVSKAWRELGGAE